MSRRSAAKQARAYAKERELADDANVVLDALLAYRERDVRDELLTLMRTAIKLHAEQFPRRHFTPGARTKRLHGWQGKIGMSTKWGQGEHHYVCVFCDDNIHTVPNRGVNMVTRPVVTRMERHGWECGLRYLMKRGERCVHLADSEWPGPPCTEGPCSKCGRYYVDE